jgi:hypothetical protein
MQYVIRNGERNHRCLYYAELLVAGIVEVYVADLIQFNPLEWFLTQDLYMVPIRNLPL